MGNPGSAVAIYLYKAGIYGGTITNSTSLNTGSYTWNINPSGTTGSDYQVKVESSSVSDMSDANFTLIIDNKTPTPTPTPIPTPTTNEQLKIGIYKDGVWYIDHNTNGIFDTSTDKQYTFGAPGWTAIVDDWNGDGKTEIGVYQNGVWYLDYNGNGVWDAGTDKQYNFGGPGWTSLVGDWNGDGKSEVGVYQNGVWYLDHNGNGVWDAGTDKQYNFGATSFIPVIGKWS
jgi:hypothetical protein